MRRVRATKSETVGSEEHFLRSLFELRSALPGFKHPRKMMVESLRHVMDMLDASAGAVAMLSRVHAVAELVYALPVRSEWNIGLLNDHIKLRKPQLPPDLILAPVKRRDRPWGVIAARMSEGRATSRNVSRLHIIADLITEAIERFDDDRVDRLILSLEHKIANRQRPKDTIYDIIHGIRDLTQYDHSASLYVAQPASTTFELIAEQIAWKKARSRRVGQKIELNPNDCRHATEIQLGLFRKIDNVWVAAESGDLQAIPDCIVPLSQPGDSEPEEHCMLCAFVQTPDKMSGILKVSSRESMSLGVFEAALLDRLMPMLSLVLQFLHRTEQLEDQVLKAERKGALADLSRGIAHDVNNALGSVIPLIQQLKHDAEAGRVRSDILTEDLAAVESGLQSCRRIFGGLLASARSGDRSIGNGNVRRALDTAVSILQDRVRRQGVSLSLDVPDELPVVRGNQGDITQVFLNLLSNSLDATNHGGNISIRAHNIVNGVEVLVVDDGCGIPAEVLPTVTDPFVTTKKTGNGLGLAICRSILWEIGGEMRIESDVSSGTAIHLKLAIDRE